MYYKTALAQTSSVEKTSQYRSVEQLSWEYLMPKRKERMAGYIRESDPTLADSTTIESQAKAVRMYAEKEGYIYDVAVHEYREAISAYTIPYMEREKLLKLLEAAKRQEFDVLAVTEIRAVSRRQVEVFIIYDMLQKYGIRLETIKEKFEDDAMGRVILGLRAGFAEIEREQSYWRMQRGRKDRIAIGNAPNGHAKPAYGYILVDTDREVHGRYEFNYTIIYVDEEGNQWSEYTVCIAIFEWLKQGDSLHAISYRMNDLGIPPPQKPRKGSPHWTPATILKIARHPIYMGEVWANRYKRVGKKVVLRPKEEWILLPAGTAPAYIDKDTFEAIQKQLKINKDEALRNNKHKEALGLLRGGYIFCGICGCRMHVQYPPDGSPRYICNKKVGSKQEVKLNHNTQIRMPLIDRNATEKIIEVLQNPALVRAKVEKLRDDNTPVINAEDIETTIENIRHSMQNLFDLAQNATTDDTIAELTERMNNLENQKRAAEAILYDVADDEEERAELEKEFQKFEKWVADVQPYLTDPTYIPTYEELRLAVRILGLRCIIFPTAGNWPFRYEIDVTVPEIMKKLHCVTNDPKCAPQPSVQLKSSTSVQCR